MKSDLIPKKKFSQNFLVDPAGKVRVKKQVIEFLETYPDRPVIEVGPGQGDMTQWLIDTQRDVQVIEIDPDAVSHLRVIFDKCTNISILQADAIEICVTQQMRSDTVFVSNLPYNIGSRLLIELGQYYPQIPFAVILQKEVISKIVRRDSFTFFGAFVALWWNCKRVMDLPPGYFYPQPRVYSSMIIGTPRIDIIDKCIYLSTVEGRVQCKNLLKLLFSNPNKTLINNLKYTDLTPENIDTFMRTFGYSPTTRLTWENYEQIVISLLQFINNL
jgi:16S rRNA (adenine1518-N6/adenine1519-N6)-dimethyltransferase